MYSRNWVSNHFWPWFECQICLTEVVEPSEVLRSAHFFKSLGRRLPCGYRSAANTVPCYSWRAVRSVVTLMPHILKKAVVCSLSLNPCSKLCSPGPPHFILSQLMLPSIMSLQKQVDLPLPLVEPLVYFFHQFYDIQNSSLPVMTYSELYEGKITTDDCQLRVVLKTARCTKHLLKSRKYW